MEPFNKIEALLRKYSELGQKIFYELADVSDNTTLKQYAKELGQISEEIQRIANERLGKTNEWSKKSV